MDRLPVEEILPDLNRILSQHPAAVLEAPPGAGKTTGVPLALLNQNWLKNKRIIMLAPRRLAARAAAGRMAHLLKERVGKTVGYRVRMDSRVGPQTRIEVVTEGVLTRRLQSDPGLNGVGMVIFDEFHERSLDGDLGLALCLDLQGVLNEDLRILVMSATLDTEPVAKLLGDAPRIRCEGRTFAVETRYLPPRRGQSIQNAVTAAILQAVKKETGSLLVFLPGAPEIRRVAQRLKESDLGPSCWVAPLYGQLTRANQLKAIVPPPKGHRKIVLATSIAETSLTIEGIRVVIDAGLMRVPRFDVGSGMSRLMTMPVSRASADQRSGRAGRLAPGICYRLWDRGQNKALPAFNLPEILEIDLTGLVLELASWGISDSGRLKWLNPPPPAAFSQARALLIQLGVLDEQGQITDHGRQVARLPLHPRLAHMLLKARGAGMVTVACHLAALLSEPDPLQFAPGERDSDLKLRMDLMADLEQGKKLNYPYYTIRFGLARQIKQVAGHLRRYMKPVKGPIKKKSLGWLAAWSYPDRIARKRPGGCGRYQMVNGRGVVLDPSEPLAAETYMVALELDGDRRDARVFRAVAYDGDMLREQYGYLMRTKTSITWDTKRQTVVAEWKKSLGVLTIHSTPIANPDPARVCAVLITGIREVGITCLPWTKRLRHWQSRAIFVGRQNADPRNWPDFSDTGLLDDLEKWLMPFLSGISKLAGLSRIDLKSALAGRLSWKQNRLLADLAPTHFTVPSGSRIPIDYSGDTPVLAVRLQELFGLSETPAIWGGRRPLRLHLLSPAGRPVQITADLAGFWAGSYAGVRKDMRGRYPKHYWPEDPLQAVPTRRVRPHKHR